MIQFQNFLSVHNLPAVSTLLHLQLARDGIIFIGKGISDTPWLLLRHPKDHGKSYIKVKPLLLRDLRVVIYCLLRNLLVKKLIFWDQIDNICFSNSREDIEMSENPVAGATDQVFNPGYMLSNTFRITFLTGILHSIKINRPFPNFSLYSRLKLITPPACKA